MASVARKIDYPDYVAASSFRPNTSAVTCDWDSLRMQLLAQWDELSGRELDSTGRDRHKIAVLVQCKYGVSARLVENYLSNLERTLPALQ